MNDPRKGSRNDSLNVTMNGSMNGTKELAASEVSYIVITPSATLVAAPYTTSSAPSYTVSSTISSTVLPSATPVAPFPAPAAEFRKFSKCKIFIGTTLIIIGLLWLFALVSEPIYKAYAAANEWSGEKPMQNHHHVK